MAFTPPAASRSAAFCASFAGTAMIPILICVRRRKETNFDTGRTGLSAINLSRTVLSKPATMPVARYAEVIGKTTRVKDILTGRYYDLSKDLQLKPRQSLVLEFVMEE